MLKHRPVAFLFCGLALATFVISRFTFVSPVIYLAYALAWSIALFCGCYFIGLNYFTASVNRAVTREKIVALSFDDGPAGATPALLDILSEKKVEVVFFCIGRNIAGNENILRRAVKEGHIIGNHSFSHHPLFDLFGQKKMLADVDSMSEAIKNTMGLQPALFRPPFGVTNPTVAKIISQGRYISVGWNLRSYDTMEKYPEKLCKKIRRGLKPGGIILLHDTAPVTLLALPKLIDEIRAAGYRLARLDKMCNLNPYA